MRPGDLKILTDGKRLALGHTDGVFLCENATLYHSVINDDQGRAEIETSRDGYQRWYPGIKSIQVDVGFLCSDADFIEGVTVEEAFHKDDSIADLFCQIADRVRDREV